MIYARVCVRERERLGFGKEERVKLIVCERDFIYFFNKNLRREMIWEN